MTLSSLREKINTSKMLVFAFLVGLLSLTFLVWKISSANAATAINSTTGTATVTTTNAILFRFSTSSNDSSQIFGFSSSTNGTTWGPTTTQATTTVTEGYWGAFMFVGLATDTLYYFRAGGGDAVASSSAPFASTTAWTYAATPGTVSTATSTAPTTFTLTVNSSTNPVGTSYIVFDSAQGLYLQSNSTWGAATATIEFVDLGSNSGTTTLGLTANTLHTIQVAAVNGNSTQTTSYSTGVSAYTLANTPSSAAVTAGSNNFAFSWTGESTAYYAEDITAGTNTGWTTATSLSVLQIPCNTSHSFRVKGRNGDLVETAWSSTVSATTEGCGAPMVGGGNVGVPATPATPATPAVPGVSPAVPATPATPATPASVSLPSTASSVAVFRTQLRVGSRSNEVKALQAKLRELGYFTYPTDTGFFGGVTRAAVVAFQKAQSLKPYPGWVGPATRAALNSL